MTRTFQPLRQLREEVDRLVNDVWGSGGPMSPGFISRHRSFPTLNVWETDGEIWAEAELPGVSEEDLDISVVGRELTIKGERKATKPDESVFHRQERGLGAFTRSIELPLEVDIDQIEATLRDGVLSLRLPKAESVKPRKININVD